MNETDSLKTKTILGLFYSFGSFIANSGINFIVGIILARLLLPEDYGVIGMIMVFMIISQTFIDSGMTNALIRENKSSQEDYSTVFYYNIFISVVMYAVIFISANTISKFFREPQLIDILRVIGLTLIINSLGLIQRTILIKNLDFKTQAKIEVIASCASGIIAIIFAYLEYGVWSLIIKTLSMQVILTFLLILCNKWVPSLVFNISSFKRLFGFGWKMLVSGMLATLYQNVYDVIIGRIYLAAELGYYTKSIQLRDLAANSITTSVAKVSYPVFSSLQSDNNSLKLGFKKIIKNTSFITFPMMVGLAVVASPLIHVLFGDNWLHMVPYFQILCLTGMTLPHRSINLNILQVKGRSDLFLELDIVKIIIGIITIGIVIFFNLGIYGLLWTTFINAKIAFFLNSHFSEKFISYSTKEQIKDMMPMLISAILMGVMVYFSGFILPLDNFLKLLVQICFGVITYIGISKLAKIEELDTAYRLARVIFNKIKEPHLD